MQLEIQLDCMTIKVHIIVAHFMLNILYTDKKCADRRSIIIYDNCRQRL